MGIISHMLIKQISEPGGTQVTVVICVLAGAFLFCANYIVDRHLPFFLIYISRSTGCVSKEKRQVSCAPT